MESATKRVVIVDPEPVAMPGGPQERVLQTADRERQPAQWHGIGILYYREDEGIAEFRLLYEAHVSKATRDGIAERFGVGAIEWKVA